MEIAQELIYGFLTGIAGVVITAIFIYFTNRKG